MEKIDIFVYIALSEEFQSAYDKAVEISEAIFKPQELVDWPLTIYKGQIHSAIQKRTYDVVILPAGKMGNTHSAAITSFFLTKYSIANIVVLGIAGSVSKDLNLGDVFIPDCIEEYLANSSAEGDDTRWKLVHSGIEFPINRRLLNRFQQIKQTKPDHYQEWKKECAQEYELLIGSELRQSMAMKKISLSPEANIFAGDDRKLASGPTVDKSISFSRWLKHEVDRKIAAVEMESAGVFDASLSRSKQPRIICIRGISDFGDERKDQIQNEANDCFRKLAIKNAFSLLLKSIDADIFCEEPTDINAEEEKRETESSKEILDDTYRQDKSTRAFSKNYGQNYTLAYCLYEKTVWNIPIDLTSVWGSERGSYFGIVLGSAEIRVFNTFLAIERSLESANESRNVSQLNARWWLEINPFLFANGPSSIDELTASIISDKPFGSSRPIIEIEDFSNTSYGFFITLNPDSIKPPIEDLLSSWYHSIKKLLPGKQLAFIVHVVSEILTSDLQDSMKLLHEKLQSRIGNHDAYIVGDNTQIKNFTSTSFDRNRGGENFHEGLIRVLTSPQNQSKLNLLKKNPEYQILFSEYSKIAKLSHEVVWNEKEDTFYQLLQNIENLEKSGKAVTRPFLRFIGEFSPEIMPRLIFTFASSTVNDIKWQALKYASVSDNLIDTWLMGFDMQSAELPRSDELNADPEYGSFANSLMLGLLRFSSKNESIQDSKEKILTLFQYVSPDLQTVCNLFLEDTTEETFLRSHKSSELLLATRARYQISNFSKALQIADLDFPEIWWLLLSQKMTTNSLRILLCQELRKRAVFGLCSYQEFLYLSSDANLVNQIKECRRNRPLFFE